MDQKNLKELLEAGDISGYFQRAHEIGSGVVRDALGENDEVQLVGRADAIIGDSFAKFASHLVAEGGLSPQEAIVATTLLPDESSYAALLHLVRVGLTKKSQNKTAG